MLLLPEGLNPGSYTPFTANNKLDEKVLGDELKRVVKGSTGLHGPAGHSEFASLTFDEWKAWTNVLIDVAHGSKIQAWPFMGAESFEKLVPYVEHAIKKGADGIIVIAPYFSLYSQEAAFQFYRDLAKEFSDTSIVFYPSMQTGNHFTPATTARIAEIPNIVGMKFSDTDTFTECADTITLTKNAKNFNLVTGGLMLLYPMLCNVDIKSSYSAMSNFAHEWSLNLWNAYLRRDWVDLEKWHNKINRIAKVLAVTGDRHVGGRGGHKAALALLGHPVGNPRRPGLPATEEQIAGIRKAFQEMGLL